VSKLTVVVTCTNRKKSVPTQGCSIRDLPPTINLPVRADRWLENMSGATERFRLRELYKGDAWRRSIDIERAARAKGFEVELLVASAGLGLRSIDDVGPSYGATFSPGHPDSVGPGAEWWRAIAAGSRDRLARAAEEGPVMFVISARYATALEADIRYTASKAAECLVIGGAREIPGATRVAANAALAAHFGGTLGSLNQRTARAWIDRLESSSLIDADAQHRWHRWVGEIGPRSMPKREPASDSAIRHFVARLRSRDPGISRTRALKTLRASGIACEQARFAQLFEQESTG